MCQSARDECARVPGANVPECQGRMCQGARGECARVPGANVPGCQGRMCQSASGECARGECARRRRVSLVDKLWLWENGQGDADGEGAHIGPLDIFACVCACVDVIYRAGKKKCANAMARACRMPSNARDVRARHAMPHQQHGCTAAPSQSHERRLPGRSHTA